MSYRGTGRARIYIPTTDISLEILQYQAQEELKEPRRSSERRLGADVAWEHVLRDPGGSLDSHARVGGGPGG